MTMKKILLLLSLITINACANLDTQVENSENAQVLARVNNFPTRDRVDYVLECVAKHGGLSYINQYACGCKIDKIAEQLSFEEFDAARTFVQMQKTPGEQGAAFRDPQQSKDLRNKLKEADAAAEKACFVQ